jgi:glycosyltransferase involved in cell wall biosynthesis
MAGPPVAAFVVPGDIRARTGGSIYDRRLLAAMAGQGLPVELIESAGNWPDPGPAAQAALIARLGELPPEWPVIFDGLVFGALETGLLDAIAAPVVVMLHHPLGLEPGLAPARASRLLAQEAANLRRADHVVVPSPHVRDEVIARLGVAPDAVSVALPGFDRPPSHAAAPVPAQPPLILSVGLICARKGHDVLLRALGEIAHLDWQAAIVGLIQDRGLYRALLALRDDLGFAGRVEIPGEIGSARLAQLFARARLFALATRYEGYGMVLGEAQLHGLPIISCAVGAVPGTVPPEAGILVPPDDPAAFAAALARVLGDAELSARLAAGSARLGHLLPRWEDAAAVMGRALRQAMQDRAAVR